MEAKNIHQAINAVMKDVGAVGKNKKNDTQKYMYRGIDDVMAALAPAMQEHGIYVTPEVLEQAREEREGRTSKLLYSIVKVKYTFWALDGSNVETVVMGEGMDSGDKATNKAMSAAFKYALLQTFCIPTEEMADSEQDSPEVAKGQLQNHQPRRLTQQEAETFTAELQAANVNIPALLQMYKAGSIGEMTAQAMADIRRKISENHRNAQANNGGAAASAT